MIRGDSDVTFVKWHVSAAHGHLDLVWTWVSGGLRLLKSSSTNGPIMVSAYRAQSEYFNYEGTPGYLNDDKKTLADGNTHPRLDKRGRSLIVSFCTDGRWRLMKIWRIATLFTILEDRYSGYYLGKHLERLTGPKRRKNGTSDQFGFYTGNWSMRFSFYTSIVGN